MRSETSVTQIDSHASVQEDPNKKQKLSLQLLSRSQKAAIVLASLGAELAKEIVGELGDYELKEFAKAFSTMQSIAPEILDNVVAEFSEVVTEKSVQLPGGITEAQKILVKIAGEDRTRKLFDESKSEPVAPIDNLWERIEKIENERLLEFLKAQRPIIFAAILSRLSSEKSAALISELDLQTSEKVLLELAEKPTFEEPVIFAIAKAIEQDLLSNIENELDYTVGGAAVGEIMNFLPAEKRDSLLSKFASDRTEVARAVRKVLLTFSELPQRLAPESIPAVVKAVDRKNFLDVLKYGQNVSAETIEFLFANFSKRLGEQIREEVEEINPLEEPAGEEALRTFIVTIKELANKGEVIILDAVDGDE